MSRVEMSICSHLYKCGITIFIEYHILKLSQYDTCIIICFDKLLKPRYYLSMYRDVDLYKALKQLEEVLSDNTEEIPVEVLTSLQDKFYDILEENDIEL